MEVNPKADSTKGDPYREVYALFRERYGNWSQRLRVFISEDNRLCVDLDGNTVVKIREGHRLGFVGAAMSAFNVLDKLYSRPKEQS